jgi:hypothetical protein
MFHRLVPSNWQLTHDGQPTALLADPQQQVSNDETVCRSSVGQRDDQREEHPVGSNSAHDTQGSNRGGCNRTAWKFRHDGQI